MEVLSGTIWWAEAEYDQDDGPTAKSVTSERLPT